MSYADYRQLIDTLMEEGKVTGPHQSESMLKYTQLNVYRMQRLEKRYSPSAELVQSLKKVAEGHVALIISEGWCGDASQVLPVFEAAAQAAGIATRYVLRDEHLALMDEHLTNGSRSIPIILLLNKQDFELVGSWGPRPKPAQKMMQDHLQASEPKPPKSEVAKEIQLWYARDKQSTMEEEWMRWVG